VSIISTTSPSTGGIGTLGPHSDEAASVSLGCPSPQAIAPIFPVVAEGPPTGPDQFRAGVLVGLSSGSGNNIRCYPNRRAPNSEASGRHQANILHDALVVGRACLTRFPVRTMSTCTPVLAVGPRDPVFDCVQPITVMTTGCVIDRPFLTGCVSYRRSTSGTPGSITHTGQPWPVRGSNIPANPTWFLRLGAKTQTSIV